MNLHCFQSRNQILFLHRHYLSNQNCQNYQNYQSYLNYLNYLNSLFYLN